MRQLLERFTADPAGALWIGLLVAFVLFGQFDRPASSRNRAVLGLLLLAPFLSYLLILRNEGWITAWTFTAVYVLTGLYAVWAAVLALKPRTSAWKPNPSVPAMRALVAALLVLNTLEVFGSVPDDSGIYANLAAQRWSETGVLPYADPKFKGPTAPAEGGASTYGPLLYAAHLPFQRLAGRPRHNAPDVDLKSKAYRWPPMIATQLTCYAFYLVGIASLYVVVRRHTSESVALAAVALYASSPYILGLGGVKFGITGLAFISHIAPPGVVLVALAVVGSAFLSGAFLAVATGVLFFPAFLFPLWFGWMLGRDRRAAAKFAIGFLVTGAAIAALVVWFTHAPPGTNALSLVLESTLERQEGFGAKAYGASEFGFWGTHPRLAAFWQAPLIGGTSLFKPTFLLFAALALSTFFVASARRLSVAQLAGLTAMLMAAIQLWKTHAGGTYVEWYYPFLIVALLVPHPRAFDDTVPDHAAEVHELV